MAKDVAALADFLSAEDLARIARPTGEAAGLPAAAYVDPSFAKLENERLFARTWMCAGYGREIPAPGDALPLVIAGAPIFVARDRGDTVNAFHNVCAHRGNLVLREPQRGSPTLRCRYHGWTYDLAGKLLATPHWGGYNEGRLAGFDRACHGLKPVRVVAWHDWLFVNIDGKAPPFEEYIGPFVAHLEEYDLDRLVHCQTVPVDIKANWKLIEENFLEVLHLPNVHAGLNSVAPFKDHAMVSDGPCLGTIIEVGLPRAWSETSLPRFARLPKNQRTAKNLALFPNFKLVIGPDHCASMVEFPLDAGRSHQRWDFYFVGREALAPRYAKARAAIIAFFSEVNREDVSILEGMQIARGSPAADGGVFSAIWEPVAHDFQKLVVAALAP